MKSLAFLVGFAVLFGCASREPVAPKSLAYSEELMNRVRRVLAIPPAFAQKELETLLSFRVDKKGNVRDFWLDRSSGNPDFDSLARNAIEKAAPLPAPPSDLVEPGDSSVRIRAAVRSR